MPVYDFSYVIHPVFGGEHITAFPSFVAGTAFDIGGGYFLTAGHVAGSVSGYASQSLGFLAPGDQFPGHKVWAKGPIAATETHPEYNLAVLRCSAGPTASFPWMCNSRLDLLDPVICGGFPFGHDVANLRLTTRAYAGAIAAHYPFLDLPAKPEVYELSFPAPRGLSGAPVLVRIASGVPHVVGIVIGNGKSQMLVASFSEKL